MLRAVLVVYMTFLVIVVESRSLRWEGNDDAHSQDQMVAFRNGFTNRANDMNVCDELCPDPGTKWYIRGEEWSTVECESLDRCDDPFHQVDREHPLRIEAKSFAWFTDRPVRSWATNKKMLAYCRSWYFVDRIVNAFGGYFEISVSNSNSTVGRCCGFRVGKYDTAENC